MLSKKLNQMKKRIQNYLRKKRHLRYTSLYITDLRWEIINTVTSSAQTGFNEGTSKQETITKVLMQPGTELMLINKHNYKALLDVLIQVHLRGQLARDEQELLKRFVEF